jgi:hypothetical protein
MDTKRLIITLTGVLTCITLLVIGVFYQLSKPTDKAVPAYSYVDATGQVHDVKPKDTAQHAQHAQSTPTSDEATSYNTANEELQELWQSKMGASSWQLAIYDRNRKLTYQLSSTNAEPMTLASVTKIGILGSYLTKFGNLEGSDKDLAEKMIRQSDNDSAQTLYEKVGSQGVQKFYDTVGATNTTVDTSHWGLTTSTAIDQLMMLKSLYGDASPVLDDAVTSTLPDMMAQVESDQRWGVGEMSDTTSLKNGWLPDDDGVHWTLNSVGEVSGKASTYDVVMLTHGLQYNEGITTLNDLAEKTMTILESVAYK